MNKALLTVLVVAIVAGVFVEQSSALLRAGRDRIEKFQRELNSYKQQEAEMNPPMEVYYRRRCIIRLDELGQTFCSSSG
ncbi:unnamed protein product, partial [Porites evermanni]